MENSPNSKNSKSKWKHLITTGVYIWAILSALGAIVVGTGKILPANVTEGWCELYVQPYIPFHKEKINLMVFTDLSKHERKVLEGILKKFGSKHNADVKLKNANQ
ncbi:MAG: hypothetical protein P8168_07310, partial [Deltaproteobacteria bacterium]